jgi:FAD-dependent urate hydroxylase
VDVPLVIVGAGPYGVAAAAYAQSRGIDTVVLGRPMEFWTAHMPEGMCLRSGLDWHLDAAGEETFEAFAEERGISPSDVDPVPIAVFLSYAAWFQARTHVEVTEKFASSIGREGDRFVVRLDDGTTILAERVLVAPGARYFARLPAWAPDLPTRGVHTVDSVRFDELDGARVLVVGGRQSAYEWAALLGEHGAARVDVVHRHPEPKFDRVSWAFADRYVDETVSTEGWWRGLPLAERQAIERQFWEVGRLTLEWWLAPRLDAGPVRRWPETHVEEVRERDDRVDVRLSNGESLEVDEVLFATGYQPDVSRVPYLAGLQSEIERVDGFPVLDEWFQTSVLGLFVTGLASTRDFGPFFGFTKGCPAAARLVVEGLLRGG